MHVKDFDKNGFSEQVVSCYVQGVSYPIVLRDDLIKTLPYLKSRYLNYKDYARQTITDIFPANELADAVVKKVHTFATSMARNEGNGSFTLVPLPFEAQIAPMYGILAGDYDRDGALDLLLAGNFDGVKPEIGRMHASYGVFLRGDGKGGFVARKPSESGFFVPGQGRDIQPLRTARGVLYVVTRNNDRALVFRATPGGVLQASR
jgi:enediyne biosynthesis protein E4